MYYLIKTRTRLCVYKTGNSFLIVDKQTDREIDRKISKKWAKYIVNENAVLGKNSILYKTHKPNNPVRFLKTNRVLKKQSVLHLLMILKQG